MGNGDGTFRYGASYPGGTAPAAIAVADLNGDHNLDLAIADSEGNGISVMLGRGDGTFRKAVNYPTRFPSWVTTADVNGDHIPDLVAANFEFSSGASVNSALRALSPNPSYGDTLMRRLLLFSLALTLMSMFTLIIPAKGQYGSLPIGTFNSGNSTTCQTGGWYYYTDAQGMKHYMNCFTATVTGCNNDATLGLTYGYLDPVGLGIGVNYRERSNRSS